MFIIYHFVFSSAKIEVFNQITIRCRVFLVACVCRKYSHWNELFYKQLYIPPSENTRPNRFHVELLVSYDTLCMRVPVVCSCSSRVSEGRRRSSGTSSFTVRSLTLPNVQTSKRYQIPYVVLTIVLSRLVFSRRSNSPTSARRSLLSLR